VEKAWRPLSLFYFENKSNFFGFAIYTIQGKAAANKSE
jgi:hypothetical protein